MKKTPLYHDGSCSRTHLRKATIRCLIPKESSLNNNKIFSLALELGSALLSQQNVSKITAPDIRSRSYHVERVRKTEGLIDPRPEDGASGPPKFQPIGRGDENPWEVNPFPFPRCIATIILQGKTCFKEWFGRYPEYKKS